jgi:hypothetical protein
LLKIKLINDFDENEIILKQSNKKKGIAEY